MLKRKFFYWLTISNFLYIIVLLILAGVTIATLTGQNGILTRANEASEKTKQANDEEQVKLSVVASIGTDGKINIEAINKNLGNIEGLTHNGELITDNPIENLPATVVVKEYNFIIKEDGNVVVPEWTQKGYEITNGKITVKVGDIVLNYEGSTEGKVTIETKESGHVAQQNLTTENLGWKILGIGEDGGLELISDNPTSATVTLAGEEGYLNAEKLLNTVCNELYGKGEYTKSARSLNIEDINKLTNYDPKSYSEYGYLWKYRFSIEEGYMQYCKSTDEGQTWSDWENITDERYQKFRMPGSTEIINAKNPKESQEIKKIYYKYAIILDNAEVADMITKGKGNSYITQWLASKTVGCSSNYAGFYVRIISDDNVSNSTLYDSFDYSRSLSKSIRPVVTLQPNIQLEGNSENGWIIK